MGYLGANFDPSISWKDLEWIRAFWKGPMVIKGILDPEDARGRRALWRGRHHRLQPRRPPARRRAVFARARPPLPDAVKGQIKILADSGIRNGLDVVRAIALGADCAMIGRAFTSRAGRCG